MPVLCSHPIGNAATSEEDTNSALTTSSAVAAFSMGGEQTHRFFADQIRSRRSLCKNPTGTTKPLLPRINRKLVAQKLQFLSFMHRWAIGAALAGFLLHHHVRAASAASAGAAAGMKVGDNLKDNPEYNRSGSARPSCPHSRHCYPSPTLTRGLHLCTCMLADTGSCRPVMAPHCHSPA